MSHTVAWHREEFRRTVIDVSGNAEIFRVEPQGQLIYSAGTAVDLGVAAAIAGLGVIYLFEDWLRLHLDSGALEPELEPWRQWFSGPYLYYPGRRLIPSPLRAFIDFVKSDRSFLNSN